MSSGKKRKDKEASRPAGPATPPHASHWPEAFASPRQCVLVAVGITGWAVILGMFALGNDLLGLKQALMIVAGARMEPMLALDSMQSVDIAAVLFAFVVVIGMGYVHVSLGMAVVLAVRPWLDGFVYEGDNVYFLWAAMYLLVVWAARQWRTPRPLRGLLPLGLLALFWLLCAFSALWSIQYSTTHQGLLYWAYYGVILFLSINATQSRAARGVVLVGFFAGLAGQALYAYAYLAYVLPWMRDYMAKDPRRLAQFFSGLTEFTPEIARRMSMNRASASMVFPNALAALLILGIPACLTLAVNGWRYGRYREGNDEDLEVSAFHSITPWVLPLFLAICFPLFCLGQLALTYRLGGPPWFGTSFNLILLSVGCAALVSVAFLLAARRHGLHYAGRLLGTCTATLLLPLLLGALWITYSRGAMLALALAGVATVVLMRGRPGRLLARMRLAAAPKPACIGLALLTSGIAASVGFIHMGDAAGDDAATSGAAPAAVTDEGIDVGLGDLANPASFRLRLGYWRVALSMARDHCFTGVGLGNFKYAYPEYQYLGAGEVQNAHNGFLQAWCETGVLGALALLGFWSYVLLQALRRLSTTRDVGHQWLGWGLFCGLLAFLLHAALDINFAHPSLMTFAMAAAGLLIGMGAEGSADAGPGTRAVATALPLLLLAALFSGMATRPYLQQLGTNGGKFINVDDRTMLDRRFQTANYFLAECTAWARDGEGTPPPALPIGDVVSLHGDRATIFELGRVLAQDPAGKYTVAVPPDAAIPPGAVFQVLRPWDAHFITFKLVLQWLGELERLDARFPYVPENAMVLSRGYKLLVEQTTNHQASERGQNLDRMLKWAEEAVRRSPAHKDMYQNLAWAEWCYGTFTTGQTSLDHFKQGLAAFARSRALAPNEPDYYYAHAQALAALGQAYLNAGSPEVGQRYQEESARVEVEGRQIQERRWQLGLN